MNTMKHNNMNDPSKTLKSVAARRASESTETPCSIAAKKQKGVFSYVNITSKGCEGWLNLFVGEYCVAMVNDTEIADKIRRVAKRKK